MFRRDSWTLGLQAEEAFSNHVESRGWKVRKSNANEDMNKHIDFYVKDKRLIKEWGFDVKKSISGDSLWIEYTNVNGKKGWLRGESDYIAFFLCDGFDRFLVVDREELLDFWDVLVDKDVTTEKSQAYMRAYQRKGRKDLIAMIKEDDLSSLITTQIWVVS